MSTYRVERRTERNGGRSHGKKFFVVTGPGVVPYVSAADEQHAEYLASWMNVAFAQGKASETRAGHRLMASRRAAIAKAEPRPE